jgi:hypothetical protein
LSSPGAEITPDEDTPIPVVEPLGKLEGAAKTDEGEDNRYIKQEEDEQLGSKHHPYWSLGTVRPFLGDASLPGVLQRAARVRSHKRELIIFTSDYGLAHYALNLILNLKRLGYGHYLMIGFNEEACTRMGKIDADLGCVWDGTMEPVVGRFSQTRIRSEVWKSKERHPRLHEKLGRCVNFPNFPKIIHRLLSNSTCFVPGITGQPTVKNVKNAGL